jgi:hypothetical protein
VLEELLVFMSLGFGYFGYCDISLNLYNKMCDRLRNKKRVTCLHLFVSKPFMQTTTYLMISKQKR